MTKKVTIITLVIVSILAGSISSSFVSATNGTSPFDLIFKSLKNLEDKNKQLQNQVNTLQNQIKSQPHIKYVHLEEGTSCKHSTSDITTIGWCPSYTRDPIFLIPDPDVTAKSVVSITVNDFASAGSDEGQGEGCTVLRGQAHVDNYTGFVVTCFLSSLDASSTLNYAVINP